MGATTGPTDAQQCSAGTWHLAFAKLNTSPKKNLGHRKFAFSLPTSSHFWGVEAFLHNDKTMGAPATQPWRCMANPLSHALHLAPLQAEALGNVNYSCPSPAVWITKPLQSCKSLLRKGEMLYSSFLKRRQLLNSMAQLGHNFTPVVLNGLNIRQTDIVIICRHLYIPGIFFFITLFHFLLFTQSAFIIAR